jgi:intracellular sulfur oxidation DsrE/DsrF family protein
MKPRACGGSGASACEPRDDGPAQSRRHWLSRLPLWGATWGAGLTASAAAAQTSGGAGAAPAPGSPSTPPKLATEERIPGDPPEHHIVYQLNQADPETIEHILGSVGAMVGKYADNVAIVVVAFGPGIHLLAREPKRPVPAVLRERAAGQARDYQVRFVACGNTMRGLGWTAADMLPFVQVEAVGAAVLMELQEQGYAYLAW